MGLSTAHKAPGLSKAASRLGRRVLGEEAIPLWSRDLPGGGSRRRPLPASAAHVLLIPSCTGAMFAGEGGSAAEALVALCSRVGIGVAVPQEVASLCCGMPWTSKGLQRGAEVMRAHLAEVLERSGHGASLRVVTDAASCTEGLAKSLAAADVEDFLQDAVAFTAEVLLPRLAPRPVVEKLALHPTCSSTRSATNEALYEIAAAVADEVFVPPSWGCCGFAGDRGMLHPELTAAATAAQAAEVLEYDADAHASCNRTCELGMSRATGKPYVHVLTLLEQATQ